MALPGVMYFHGGGWMLGDTETHDRLVREIATGAQASVVFVEYARSPEAKYPVAIEQAYTATNWVAEHGASIGVDASRLAVVGEGVGGNLATVTTLLAKERGGPPIDFQVLLYPVTDADLETPSYRAFGAEGYWLTRETMRWFWDSYVPVPERHEFTVSPLRASLEQLTGTPPALILTCENDVVRDEGEAYAHKLMAAGVPVRATRYLGAIHDLVLLNPIAGPLLHVQLLPRSSTPYEWSLRTKLRRKDTHDEIFCSLALEQIGMVQWQCDVMRRSKGERLFFVSTGER